MTGIRSVLVVDPDVDTREALCGILEDAGYNIEAVPTGRDAFLRLASRQFGAVVVDPDVPDMAAAGFLETLRAASPDAVCVLLTAEPSLFVTGRVNVQLRKPVDPLELLRAVQLGAQPRVCEQAACYGTASPLEEEYRRAIHIADVLQQALIPEAAADLPGYELAATYEPALAEAEVGGDFYDVFPLPGGQTAIVMADVAGKGLQAAVYTAMTKYMIRAYAHDDPGPASVMGRLNEAMCHYSSADLFVTVFYAVLDAPSSTLVYADAGHDRPVIYSHRHRQIRFLDPTGRAIGITPGEEYRQGELCLDQGDVLLTYTDGIPDARKKGCFFGIEGVAQVLYANAYRPVAELIEVVLGAAKTFAGGTLRDDAAILVLKVIDDARTIRLPSISQLR